MQTLGVGEEVMLGELVYLMYSVDTFQKLRLQHQRLWEWVGTSGRASEPPICYHQKGPTALAYQPLSLLAGAGEFRLA